MALPEITVSSDIEETETPEIPMHEYFNGKFSQAIENLSPRLLNLSEQSLMEELNPTPVDYDLRRSFWDVFLKNKTIGKTRIYARQIYEGVCHQSYFLEHVIVNPLRVAWITRPPVNHATFYEAINRVALQKIFNYIQTHEVSEKTMAQILKLTEMSANRAYGAVAQKMQIQSKNLNIEVKGERDAPPPPDQLQLSQKIEAMQAQLMAAPKDVTPKD